MRTVATVLALATVLMAGCSTVQPLAEVSPSLTTLPLPSGATVVPYAAGAPVESCDATASLRPSTTAGPGMEEIVHRGRVPARSVVVAGTRTKEFPAGSYQLQTALIIGQRRESTDQKTSLNETLRHFGVSV